MSQNDLAPLLAFGPHPDDVEFGCGGVVAREARAGRPVHIVVCSRGEASSNGTPEIRVREAEEAAKILGASVEFVELDGDGRLDVRAEHAIKLAAIVRRLRPGIVLAPTPDENQHPDHPKLGRLVRDACRLARYAGLADIRSLPPHAIQSLLYYVVTMEPEAREAQPILVDVSAPEVVADWTAAMEAHRSQAATRNYVELQLTRARLLGMRAGVTHAIALYPGDPIVVESLSQLGRGARRF
jgi:LmbE family N-acetylglucosaminyl deacetylase